MKELSTALIARSLEKELSITLHRSNSRHFPTPKTHNAATSGSGANKGMPSLIARSLSSGPTFPGTMYETASLPRMKFLIRLIALGE